MPDEPQPSPQEGTDSVAPALGPVPSSWPIVIVPAVVIVVTAVAGSLFREQVALVVGVVTVAILAGLVGYRILRRKPARIALWACAVTLPVLGLGLLKVDDIQQAPATPPEAMSSPPAHVNAGRQFTQQKVNELRDFRGADLRGAQFVDLDLRGFDFSGANAAGASFYGSRLDRANFRGVDLGGAILIEACLLNVTMHGADLTGAIATGADVSGVAINAAETAAAVQWPRPGAPSSACTAPN